MAIITKNALSVKAQQLKQQFIATRPKLNKLRTEQKLNTIVKLGIPNLFNGEIRYYTLAEAVVQLSLYQELGVRINEIPKDRDCSLKQPAGMATAQLASPDVDKDQALQTLKNAMEAVFQLFSSDATGLWCRPFIKADRSYMHIEVLRSSVHLFFNIKAENEEQVVRVDIESINRPTQTLNYKLWDMSPEQIYQDMVHTVNELIMAQGDKSSPAPEALQKRPQKAAVKHEYMVIHKSSGIDWNWGKTMYEFAQFVIQQSC